MSKFELEELLNRKETPLNSELFKDYLNGESILITGAAGSIGSALVLWLCQFQFKKLICLDQSELGLFKLEKELGKNEYENVCFQLGSIRDEPRLDAVFEKYKPTVVFHTAAYKHVSFLEGQIYESFQTNVIGTYMLSKLAIFKNVKKFVHVSTDKSVNPISIMGATKRIAELIVKSVDKNKSTEFCIARFGNVLGSSGSIVPTVLKSIVENQEISITNNKATRYFMTNKEACLLILYAGVFGKNNSSYMFEMGSPIRVEELILKIFRKMNKSYSDWKIEDVGLKKGEKLNEELVHEFECFSGTEIDAIKEIILKSDNTAQRIDLEKLNQMKNIVDEHQILAYIKEVLPDFVRSA